MTIAKLQTMRRLLLGIRGHLDSIVAMIEAELRERGAAPERTIQVRDIQRW